MFYTFIIIVNDIAKLDFFNELPKEKRKKTKKQRKKTTIFYVVN